MISYASVLKMLPFVTEIASIVAPIFTKSTAGKSESISVEAKQIMELQEVAGRNSEALKNLASDFEKALKVIGEGAMNNENEIARINIVLNAATSNAMGIDEAIKKIIHDGQISKIIGVVSVLFSLVAIVIAFYR